MGIVPNNTAGPTPGELNTETEPPVLLAQERANATFDPRQLTYYLDGSKKQTEQIEAIMTSIERDPLFNNDKFYDLTKDELRELSVQRVASLATHVATTYSFTQEIRFNWSC